MDIWIHWTDKSEEHIARHAVAPVEVEEATQSPFWSFTGMEGSTIVLGKTYGGRHLTVVLVESITEYRTWYVATARDMTASERRTFKRKCG